MNIIKSLIYGDTKPDGIFLAASMFKTISNSSLLRDILTELRSAPHTVARTHIVTLIATHLLFMRVVGDNYRINPVQDEQNDLFNSMSDETKRLLGEYGYADIPLTSIFVTENKRLDAAHLLRSRGYQFTAAEPAFRPEIAFSLLLLLNTEEFLKSFPGIGLSPAKINTATAPNIAMLLASFMLYSCFEPEISVPKRIENKFCELGGFIAGSVNSSIQSSPIR